MAGVTVLSLLLLGTSGLMIDAQLRAHRRRLAAGGLSNQDLSFYGRQHRWRMAANVLIGAVGVLVAVWPAVPRTKEWLAPYLALLLFAVMGMVTMAMLDALAINRRYRRDRMRQIAEEAKFAVEVQRKKLEASKSQHEDE